MNILGLALFTLQILLETYFFPNYPSEHITPKLLNLLSNITTLYLARSELKKQSKQIFFLVIVANTLIKKYLFSYYYPTYAQPDIIFELVLSFFVALSFIFASQKDFEQIEESQIIPDLRKFFCSVVFANSTAHHFEHYTFSGMNEKADFNFQFLSENCERLFADFIILNAILVLCHLINYSAKRDSSHLKAILRYFVINCLMIIVYFATFNSKISSKIYEVLFEYVSKPYNIVVYNMFAYPAVSKFKIAFAFIFYLV